MGLTVGKRLKMERERLGMSQGDLADALGMKTKQQQSGYERDISSPASEYWTSIARLGFDINYILTGVSSHAVNEDPTAYTSRRDDANLQRQLREAHGAAAALTAALETLLRGFRA